MHIQNDNETHKAAIRQRVFEDYWDEKLARYAVALEAIDEGDIDDCVKLLSPADGHLFIQFYNSSEKLEVEEFDYLTYCFRCARDAYLDLPDEFLERLYELDTVLIA